MLYKKITVLLCMIAILISCTYLISIAVPSLENIYGEKRFINGISIGDANTATIDPNGLAKFKNIGVGATPDANIPIVIDKSGIATTSTTGLTLQNTTASTVGVPVQYSPALQFSSSAWDTDANSTGYGDLYSWKIEDNPESSTTTYGDLGFYCSKNNGAYTRYLHIKSNGATYCTYLVATTGNINNTQTMTATSTDGLILQTSSTSASSGTPVRMSPRLRLQGKVWNTTGAGSNETSDWIMENLPVSGTTPSSLLKFGYSANGGAYSYPLTVKNDGTVNNNGLNTYKYSGALADDATITLPTITTGGMLKVWTEAEYAEYFIKADGSVEYIRLSTNSDDQNTDGYLVVYDGGSTAVIGNRLGSEKTVNYVLEYK